MGLLPFKATRLKELVPDLIREPCHTPLFLIQPGSPVVSVLIALFIYIPVLLRRSSLIFNPKFRRDVMIIDFDIQKTITPKG